MPVNTYKVLKKSLFLLLVFALAAGLFGCAGQPAGQSDKVSKTTLALNTAVTVTLYGAEDDSLIDGCFELCRKYELIFSRTDERSELYKLNAAGSMEVSPELLDVIQTALSYCELSDGAFDITLGRISDEYAFTSDEHHVPTDDELRGLMLSTGREKIELDGSRVTLHDGAVIDLGAIAKGYIADRLDEYLVENGQQSAIIDLGGNIRCVGTKPGGEPFTVGIQYPFGEVKKSIAAVKVDDLSVVTSGIYERSFEQDGVLYHHILDPKTGRPCDNGLLAVSIISQKSVDGDALSTACFALGLDKGLELIESLDGIEAVFVTDDYALHYSSGFESYIA
jgi:thiamine biosynthesis lipoprotein